MRKLLILFFALILVQTTFSQVRFGLKGGASTADVDASDFVIVNNADAEQFKVALDDANYGVHIGAFLHIPVGRWHIRPEVLFNSNRVDYRIDDFSLGTVMTSYTSEKYEYLDIPILFGANFAFLRLNAGPVAHLFLDSTQGLLDIDGYKQDFKNATLGWQAGIGLDLFQSIAIDLRYEGNFRNYGEHITVFGQDFDFADNDNRILLSLGIMF